MESNHFTRGFNYPTRAIQRCPKFHLCIATKKCQSYNRHERACFLCEQRVYPATNLGGCLPEGEFVSDQQNAIKVIEEGFNRAYQHPDDENVLVSMPSEHIQEEVKALEELNSIKGADREIITEQNFETDINAYRKFRELTG